MNSNLLKCASDSRLRETVAHARIFMTIHGRLCLSEAERNGHKYEKASAGCLVVVYL